MTITFNKFNPFVENLAQKGIDLSGAGLTVVLCDAAHAPVAANGVLGDLTLVSTTNLSSRVCTVSGHAQSSGTFKLLITDLVLTASGDVGPFQYVVLYDDASTGDMLIGWYNYGSEITLHNGETLTLDFDGSAGVLTLA
jgi:hypothetical protein